MKKILFLAVAVLFSTPLFAQDHRSEITVSYGYAPTSNWSDSFSAIKDLVSDAKTDISGWGAVTVGYNFRLLGPLSIGAQVVCSTNDQKIRSTGTDIKNRYWAIMPNVKWTWLNLKIITLYSRGAIGAVFSKAEIEDAKDESATRFAYQVSPIGITVGGRLALYAGGYSQRNDGTIRLSNDPRLAPAEMYRVVKEECLSIINQGCNQLGEFEDTFRRLCQDDVTAGNESIWEIPFSAGRGRVLFDLGVRHKDVDQYTKQAKGGTVGPTPIAFYKYDPQDKRRNVTCVPYFWEKGVQVPNAVNQWYFGKYRYEWMSRIVTSSNDDGVNWLYMRLADVYLMAAEAINELDGPQAAAPYLKPILDRALPADKAEARLAAATASQDAFREAIVEQRGLELCGEMLRKADLIRWNRLGSTLEAAKAEMTQLLNKEGKYAALPDKIYYQTVTGTPKAQSTVWDVVKAGETVEIYGVELGQTDEEGAALGYAENTSWAGKNEWAGKIEGLYVNDPDQYQFWPIWQTFIDNSNGMLVNSSNYQ